MNAASTDAPEQQPGLPGLDTLPEVVRARVVVLTAQVLPQVSQPPPSLRSVAGFTPARRVKLGGAAIESALADNDFRQSVGILVAATSRPAGPDNPVEDAARLWLARDGADVPTRLAALTESILAPALQREETRAAEEAERLVARVAALQDDVRRLREGHREELAGLKSENADLRRKLGDARREAKAADQRAIDAAGDLAAAEDRARAAASSAAADVRRLRAEVDQMRVAAGAQRKETRQERQAGVVRTRLLLDTLTEAAAGLRRELALPPVEGLPSDTVSSAVTPDADDASTGRRTTIDDAALLDQHLALPRAHLLVDGYNVTKTSWPSMPLDAQRTRLLQGLAALTARSRVEVTVVFDAGATAARPSVAPPRGVRVAFTAEGIIADDLIREYVAAEPPGRLTLVVTDDRELAGDVRRAGARLVSTAALAALLGPRS